VMIVMASVDASPSMGQDLFSVRLRSNQLA
jgi:hypothetical protein